MLWIKLNVIYVLCFLLMDRINTQGNELVQRLIKISKAGIWSKLENRSVLVSGYKIINLSQFFYESTINKSVINDENVHRISVIIYTALKCHCAGSMKNLHQTLYEPIKTTIGDKINIFTQTIESKQLFDINDKINSFLEELNTNIILTITILFKMSDYFPHLKFNEPFFLKMVVSIYLYIKNVQQAKVQSDLLKNEIKISNDLYVYLDGKHDTPQININADTYEIDSAEVQRMITQMMNLFDRFTIENCVTKNLSTSNLFVNHNQEIQDLINLIDLSSSQFANTFSNGMVMLNNCFNHASRINLSNSFHRMCFDYLLKVYIKNKNQNWVTIEHMYNKTKHTNEVQVLFTYLESVFKVLLKILYQKIQESIERKTLQEFFDISEQMLSKLKTTPFPAELISQFKLYLNKNDFEIDVMSEIVKRRIACLTDVKFPETMTNITISLHETIESITGVEFQQFWWVLSLFKFEAVKQSDYVYGMSFKLISDTLLHSESHSLEQLTQNDYKCNEINRIYYNFFRFKIMIDGYLQNSNDVLNSFANIKTMLLEVVQVYSYLSNHLSHVITTWSSSKYLSYNDDLLKILMVIISNLENIILHIEVYCKIQKQKNYVVSFRKKTNTLIRFGEYIMNLLDHYQICNCKLIKNRNLIFNEFNLNTIVNDDIPIAIIFLYLPVDLSETTNNKTHYKLSKSTSNNFFTNLTTEVHVEITQVQIPLKFYDLSFLNETKLSLKNQDLQNLFSIIHFNTYGSINNLINHHIHLLNSTLSLFYLVEYERNLFKWILASFYYTWIALYDSYDVLNNTNYIDRITFITQQEIMTFHLRTFMSIKFPEFCKIYLNSVNIVYDYYDLEHKSASLAAHVALTMVMIDEIKNLEVLDTKFTYLNVNNSILSIKNHDIILSLLTEEVKKCIDILNKNLIFVN